jgi:hypothetical protein
MSHALGPNFITALRNSETRAGVNGMIGEVEKRGTKNNGEVYIKQNLNMRQVLSVSHERGRKVEEKKR